MLQLDKKVITALATGKGNVTESLVKHKCSKIVSVAEAFVDPDANDTCQIRYVATKITHECKYMHQPIEILHAYNVERL